MLEMTGLLLVAAAFFTPPPVGQVQSTDRPTPLPPGVFTNRPEYAPSVPKSATCVWIDDPNTEVRERVLLHSHVLNFLRSYRGDDPVAVYLLRRRLSRFRSNSAAPGCTVWYRPGLWFVMITAGRRVLSTFLPAPSPG